MDPMPPLIGCAGCDGRCAPEPVAVLVFPATEDVPATRLTEWTCGCVAVETWRPLGGFGFAHELVWKT